MADQVYVKWGKDEFDNDAVIDYVVIENKLRSTTPLTKNQADAKKVNDLEVRSIIPKVESMASGLEIENKTILQSTSPKWIKVHDGDTGDKIQIMVDDLMPFFEQFQTLEEVYNYLESLPVDQMSSFVNNPMPVRRMIIKKLLGAPDFEAYGERIVRNVTAKSSQHPYHNITEYIGDMLEDLKSM